MSPCRIKICIKATVYLILALSLLVACNGSGGNGGSGDLFAGGGIGGTGISIGEITAFGSIIVNDVEFDTKTAQVVVNGLPVGEGDAVVKNVLALGMIVRIEGRFLEEATGTAERIEFNENVKGPVISIEFLDSIVKRIVLLGQTVIIDERTRFKNTAFDSLNIGDVLQISGWTDGTGLIQATYVAESEADNDEVSVKDIITELDVAKRTMQINQLVVDFQDAALIGFPEDEPAEGQLVVARGFLDANDVLVAEEIRLEDDLGIEDADDAEIEGIVTQVSSPQEFILSGTKINTDESTDFIGIKPDEILPGVRLLIKGSLTRGVLLADEVVSKDKVDIEGRVEKVNLGSGEISLAGLDPLIIRTNDFTKIFGQAKTLNDIEIGQQVKILGFTVGTAQVEANKVRVERRSRDKVKLQGPVNSIDLPTIRIIDVPVDTTRIPVNEFNRHDDSDDDGDDDKKRRKRKKFLDDIEIGDVVTVRGNLSEDQVVWKEIELTQDD